MLQKTNILSIDLFYRHAILSADDDNELRQIYSWFVENSELLYIDYATVRNLVLITGIKENYVHLLLLLLFYNISNGSSCVILPSKTLSKIVEEIIPGKAAVFINYIKKNISLLGSLANMYEPEELPGLHGNSSMKPVVVFKYINALYIYFSKYYHFEKVIATYFRKAVTDKSQHVSIAEVRQIADEVILNRPIVKDNKPIVFNNNQLLSMFAPLLRRFVIVSGGPGTGKTSIIINIMRSFLLSGIALEDIKLIAPTGLAAQRISESLNGNLMCIEKKTVEEERIASLKPSTVHALLEYDRRNNRFNYNEYLKLPARVLIVDEVSMLDVNILSALIKAVDDKTSVVLIGDKDQLPSVDAGSILYYLVNADISKDKPLTNELLQLFPDMDIPQDDLLLLQKRIVLLNENYRSNQDLKEFQQYIKNNEVEKIKAIPVEKLSDVLSGNIANMSGISFLKMQHDKDQHGYGFIQLCCQMYDNYFKTIIKDNNYSTLVQQLQQSNMFEANNPQIAEQLTDIFEFILKIKVLSPVKNGLFGVKHINAVLCEHFAAKPEFTGNDKRFSGMPIIIHKNNSKLHIFNGDTGILFEQNNNYYAFFKRGDSFFAIPIEKLPEYEPAFAITIHKSQGSEFDTVLFVLPELLKKNFLTKELVYTGITRAKSNIIFYGNKQHLIDSLSNMVQRESGITLPL